MKKLPLALALTLAASCGGENIPPEERTIESIELRVATKSFVFSPGNRIVLVAVVRDNFGELAPDEYVAITPDSTERATLANDNGQEVTFELLGSGPLKFTGCLVDYPELCDDLTLGIDDGQPVLAIESPSPGAEIDAAEGIVVKGTALDASGTLEVFVNGNLVDLNENHEFTHTLTPRFGIRHIDIIATDALTDATTVEMDVLWAPRYTDATDDAGKPFFSMDEAIAIWLGQDFFDNGIAFQPGPPLVTKDIADLIEVVVTNASLTDIIPPSITLPSGLGTLTLSNVMLGSPQIEASILDDGVELYVRIGDIRLTTGGTVNVPEVGSFPLTGTLNASALVYIKLKIAKASPTVEAVVTVPQFTVGIETLQGSFASPQVNAFFVLAASPLATALETQIKTALSGVLQTTVPDLLETVLASLDHALEDLTLPLDQPPLPPLTLHLSGRISRIVPDYRSSLQAPLVLSIGTGEESVNRHPESRGVARIDEADVPSEFFANGSVQVGVRFGMLNGALQVLWASGLLDLDVGSFLPPFAQAIVSDAKLVPRLPPVIRPAREGETSDLVLSLGQLELEMTSEDKLIKFGVLAEVGVDLTVVNNKVVITVAETPSLRVWQMTSADAGGLLTPELISSLVLFLWPDLRGSISSLLAIDLPIPPIDALGEIAPALEGFTLSLNETTPRLFQRGELLILDATFTGGVPTP